MAAGCATNLCALHDGRITHLQVHRCFFPNVLQCRFYRYRTYLTTE